MDKKSMLLLKNRKVQKSMKKASLKEEEIIKVFRQNRIVSFRYLMMRDHFFITEDRLYVRHRKMHLLSFLGFTRSNTKFFARDSIHVIDDEPRVGFWRQVLKLRDVKVVVQNEHVFLTWISEKNSDYLGKFLMLKKK